MTDTIQLMDKSYKSLWYSGQLLDKARKNPEQSDLAKAVGVSVDALDSGLRRLSKSDPLVPSLAELCKHANSARGNRFLNTKKGGYVADEGDDEELDLIDEHRLKRKIRELEASNKELMDKLLNTQDELGVLREAAEYKIPPLKPREHKSGQHEGCSLMMVSDCHLDEVVTLASTNGLNEYNPEVARSRMERLFAGGAWLTDHAREANIVRDMVLWVGGDIISGTIHEDLRETNAMGLPESVAFAHQILADGINFLLKDKQLESIRVVCSVGNHGRLTPKMRVHTRNETNIESLLYMMLAREFSKEKRIMFDLPQGELSYFDIYNYTVRALHGDALKYSGALGGLGNPINRAISRWDQGRRADLTIQGHWHQYLDNQRFIVNGSVIGTSAYSLHIAASHERAQQAWALLDSKRWRSLTAPVFCTEND